MTDRVRSLTVILDKDYRDEEESVGVIKQAIQMIKGVSSVESGEVITYRDEVAREEYQRKMGVLISEIATGDEPEFLEDITAAYAKLKSRRGY